MNIGKHFKKFIVVLVLLILFNFCIPKTVHAGLVEDITAAPAKIFWLMQRGVLVWMNNVFTEDRLDAHNEVDASGGNITTRLRVYLTPETIIKGKFVLFDANIFKNIEASTNQDEYYDDDDGGDVVSGKTVLRNTISGWYYTLRNFSIVALLSVLVYVGIRMIMSTLAQDKAKYKAMFKDWLVAICLVVLMHYFMIAILNISTKITEALGGGQNADLVGSVTEIIENVLDNDEQESYTYTKDSEHVYTLSDAYANILVLFGIIIYTVIFAIKYLKREFTIIFLILLGPVSCITYPIDKIGDGKAQAFNRWFSEFLFQVIIQPFHLLLYIVLIGSAAQLANANVLYALVCFAVMGPAEKFIKEMFGFKDRLGSPLGNIMKAGMARDMVSKATSRLMGGKNGSSGSGGSSDGENNNALPQRPATRSIQNGLLGSPDNSGNGSEAISPVDRTNLGTQNNSENNLLQPGNRNNSQQQIGSETQENIQDPRQAMLDAYDENYGTDEWNPQERDALARENNNSNGMQYSNDEYEQILRDSGYSDEEIAEMMRNEQVNPRQAMLDAYDDNYGTDAWNAQERDALARENNNSNGMQYSNDEYEQILRDSGYSDEEIAEMMGNVPEMAGDAAAIHTIEENEGGQERVNGETEGDRAQENQDLQRHLNDAINNQEEQEPQRQLNDSTNNQENGNSYKGNWRNIHAQRMAKKYGTTSRGKRWARRLGRGAKNGVRALAKGTLIAGAATIGASAALLTGNGAEAAAILGGTAALGLQRGKRKIKGIAKYASNSTKDYYRNNAIPILSRVLNSDENKKAFKAFESNPDELNNAILSYRKNHDGANPSYIDLQNEMKDRFALSQLKLNNDQINNAVGTYQELRDTEGMNDEMALHQAAFAAKLADRYSAKDFASEKTMNEAIKTISNSRNISKADVMKHLQRASKMKGVDMVKLPEQTRNVDINTQPAVPSWVGNLGIDEGTLTETNVEQITRLNVRIHETGFDEGQLRLLAGSINRQGSSSEIITNFEHKIEASAEYINNPSLRNDAEKYLRDIKEPVTRENIDSEMRERLILSDTFNVKGKKDLNAMRDIERKTPRTKSQKQVAREMAVATRGLSDMQKQAAEKKLTKQLTDGGTSATQAATDARNVMDLAEMYNTYQMPQ